MLPAHHLDNSDTGDAVVLAGWSYLWGALGGPLYVLAHGFTGLALAMLAISASIAAAAFLMFALLAVFVGSTELIIVGALLIGGLALSCNGLAAVEIARRGYRRRGWREGYYY